MSKSPYGRQRECRRQASFLKEAALFCRSHVLQKCKPMARSKWGVAAHSTYLLGGRYEAHFDLHNRARLPSDVGSAGASAGFGLSARWSVEVHQPKHKRNSDRQD